VRDPPGALASQFSDRSGIDGSLLALSPARADMTA
jgi:hypothetical protein